MPETPEVIRGLAATMVTKFTPPSFVPGCEVKTVTDISEYATDNGWIEAIVGGDNQQRIRYYGTPQGVGVGDFVDVEYFPSYKLYRVFGSTLGGTAAVGGLRVNKVWDSDFGGVALQTDADGKIEVGKTSGPDAKVEILDTAGAQLRLSFEDAVKFADFTVDTNHDLTIKPSSTGQIIIQPTTDSVDFFQVLDADGGTPILNVDTENERLGVGIAAPTQLLHAYADAATAALLERNDGNTAGISFPFTAQHSSSGTPANGHGVGMRFNVQSDAGTNRILANFATEATDITDATMTGDFLISLRVSGSVAEIMRLTSAGYLGLLVSSPQGMMHTYDTVSGFLLWEYDGLDATVRIIVPNGSGDALYRLWASYVLRDSAGAVSSGATNISNGASQNLTVGTNTVRLRVNADGSVDTSRTAGTDTIKVAYTLRWL